MIFQSHLLGVRRHCHRLRRGKRNANQSHNKKRNRKLIIFQKHFQIFYSPLKAENRKEFISEE